MKMRLLKKDADILTSHKKGAILGVPKSTGNIRRGSVPMKNESCLWICGEASAVAVRLLKMRSGLR